MTAITRANQKSIETLISEDWARPRYKETIWKVVSTLLFPIGLYQATCHCLAKYGFSQFILASSSEAVRLKHKHKQLIEENNQDYLDRESSGTAKKTTIRTRDGLNLDAVRIINQEQAELRPEDQKWIIYVLPAKAIWQEIFKSTPDMELTGLLDLARATQKNVLCVNYRATGGSTLSRPGSFDDLFIDIESGLKTLEGVRPKNIKFFAISLGSTIALHLANKYPEIPMTVVQNAFQNLALLAKDFSTYLINYVTKVLDERVKGEQELPIYNKRTEKHEIRKLSLPQRIRYSLEDTLLSLPHLALRVTYFFFSFLNNIAHCQIRKAGIDLIEIGKTVLIDTALTVTGLASLPLSLCTNKINQFNGMLKGFYLTHSAAITFVQSPKFIQIAIQILKTADWIIDNAKAVLALGKTRVCVVQVPHDKTVPHKASLEKAVLEIDPSFPIHHCDGHEFDQAKDHHNHMASPVHSRHATDDAVAQALIG